jgi:cellulose synthase/poly-beta-1,6-N-acetylglucosamine synthase-like glycosyltransferase
VPGFSRTTGVTFVVPVCNGEVYLSETLASIAAQADGRPMEIIVVEDGSLDDSAALLQSLAHTYPLRVVAGPRRGAAAAVNAGIMLASHPIICQVDQDVVLEPGWMTALIAALDESSVAAAQGCYISDTRASFFARVMALDLLQRYTRVGDQPDHVCTGNTVYRAAALRAVGLLDESLGYGYDNDLSYRLRAGGYRLAFCPDARSRHRWREGLLGYVTQQYGFGYGRVDLVARYPARWTGDAVSPALMMAHPLATAAALVLLTVGVLAAALGRPGVHLITAGVAILALLATERAIAGVRAWKRFNDPVALVFPLVHLVRDVAWVAAMVVWVIRRLLRRPVKPVHSMVARAAAK